MKIIIATIVSIVLYTPKSIYACSPSYLDKDDIVTVIKKELGVDSQDFKFLKFRDTKFFGGEDDQLCPRFSIRGRAKVQFTNEELGTCTVIAKENYSGKYYYDIRLKNLNCTK